MPQILEEYVMGHEPGRWRMFHKIKWHHTKDYYQLKKEIEMLIQEGHLKNYVMGDLSHGLEKSSSHERDDWGSPRLNKTSEASQGAGNKVLRHKLDTITRGFTGGMEISFVHRWYTHQILNIEDLQENLKPCKGQLVLFSREQVQVNGYITLKTTFGEQGKAKEIKIKYLVIGCPSSYNMIIRWPIFNQLDTSLSILYLVMKYPFSNGWVGIIQGDEKITIKYYVERVKMKKVHTLGVNARNLGSWIKPLREASKGKEARPPANK